MRPVLPAGCLLLALHVPSALADEALMQSVDGTVVFRGGYGITFIEANELVWDGDNKISQLIWKSQGIHTLTGAFDVVLPKDFYFHASAALGLDGNGHMADYDWFNPDGAWTHLSRHPDTRLKHYFTGNLELGRKVLSHDGTDLSLGVGFKYTDVKWAAWGGSYIYSDTGFRADRGDFDPNELGISYRQSWPVPYLAANVKHVSGAWTIAGSLQGGLAVEAYGTDDHWMRDLRFYDYYDVTPSVALKASVDYALRPQASIYLAGAFDTIFRTRADTREVDTVTGNTYWYKDGAGGDYRSMTISFGLKGQF